MTIRNDGECAVQCEVCGVELRQWAGRDFVID